MDFDRIYQDYFRDVFLYLRSLTAAADLAEELTQETFVKALSSLSRFDGSQDIRAWLFTIARNAYYSHCRRQKKYADHPPSEIIAEDSTGFTERLADEESAFLIHRFVHQMCEPYKEVFTLRIFGELPFEQIGRLFGKSAGWARVTFYRAKKQIQDYMEVMDDETN